ncbi:hypothetical protein PC117_g25604 [Phytophthora cactorum]|uniref:Uncharacterized protein n=1 Tax=Phytophthora cactorum TaxID=29920 RepID=A0A8T1AR42_9STRA|nr:hypothetical protein PC117_g25604 [Phytophthora cactorum]
MKTHPTFYVSRLKRYHGPQGPAAPQTPQASREEDPTPRNETQPQTSSNVQQRKAKTHATLVDREAAVLRLIVPVRVRLCQRCQITKGTPDLLKLAESLIYIGRGPPGDQPNHGFPRSPGPIGACGPQASRGPLNFRPGRQNHRQSRDPERSRGTRTR